MYLLGRSDSVRGKIFELLPGHSLLGKVPGKGICLFTDQVTGDEMAEFHAGPHGVTIQTHSPRVSLSINGNKTQRGDLQSGDEIVIEGLVFKILPHEKSLFNKSPGELDVVDAQSDPLALSPQADPASPPVFTTDPGQLAVVLELGNRLSGCSDQETFAQTVLGCLRQAFKAQRILVSLWNEIREQFETRAAYHKDPPPEAKPVQISRTLIHYLLVQKQAVLSRQLSVDERFQESESLLGGKIQSILCAPLLRHDQLLGLLYLDAPAPSASFTEANLEFLSAIARQASLSLDNLLMRQKLGRETAWLRSSLSSKSLFIGKGRAIQPILQVVERVAPTDVTVLLRGETGTGKELIARMIHDLSPRAHAPFESVNCAALSESVLESELFGHEKGAFTGALERKRGKFEIPDGGTLFLDEIGEISPAIQVKLLRFLQERTFERVGGTETIRVNVRIIAATNKNLEKAIQSGAFREDLYYRLQVLPIELPPLRNRQEDIPLLTRHFLTRYSHEMNRPELAIAPMAQAILTRYSWPGNVRQLKNVLERSVVLCRGDVLNPEDLPWDIQGEAPAGSDASVEPGLNYKTAQEKFEKEYLHHLMSESRGNVTQAARISQIERTHLHSKLKKYGIHPGKYRV